MKKYLFYICLVIPYLVNAQVKVGEDIIVTYQTPHPYSGNTTSNYLLVWTQNISQEGNGYVAVHFSKIKLSEQDYLIVKDANGTRSWKYTYSEIENRGNSFWSIPIYSGRVIIEIFSKASNGAYGYKIDKIAKGYSTEATESTAAICGSDDSKNAICYSVSQPAVYDKSRAVARLLIKGKGACTGWLIGDEGHLITNQHCIENQDYANNVTIEFMAEGANCTSNCNSRLACSGRIEATSATLVKANYSLDYALLRLNSNVVGTYGYLQLRQSGAVLNERIYIPQHPQGWGKRIALLSDNSNDAGGFARIFSLTSPRCRPTGNNNVGYYADTQGGSSGSPVLGYNDNLVVALHHCGSCPNKGIPIQKIIADLGSYLPNNALPSNCVQGAVVITQNVSSGNTDTKNASTSITASNVIESGATAVYKAGQSITLRPGFHAKSGSTFTASIESCGQSQTSAKSNKTLLSDNREDIKTTEPNKNKFLVYPNPSKGQFTVAYNFKRNNKYKIYVYNSLGIIIKIENINLEKPVINLYPIINGIYYLRLFSNNIEVEATKLLIKK